MQESVSFRYLEVNQIGMVLTNSNSVLDGQLAGLSFNIKPNELERLAWEKIF